MSETFKKIRLIKLEVVATIIWFLTDFLWLWNQLTFAIILMPFLIISMLISVLKVKSKTSKRVMLITLMWAIMNSVWMISDLTSNQIAVTFAKIVASTFGIIGLAQLILFFIFKPKTIQNFRRFLHVNHEA